MTTSYTFGPRRSLGGVFRGHLVLVAGRPVGSVVGRPSRPNGRCAWAWSSSLEPRVLELAYANHSRTQAAERLLYATR